MTKYRFWTPEEDAWIAQNGGKMTTKEMASELKRTESAVRNRAFYLGVSVATQRKRSAGNVPVKAKDITQAAELYRQHGSLVACARASGLPLGRLNYLVRLARLQELLPPTLRISSSLTDNQRTIMQWTKENPDKGRMDCVRHFKGTGLSYYNVMSVFDLLLKKKLIPKLTRK